MTDWPEIHENVVRQFRTAWAEPEPHAWDGFLDDSVRFVQPMLRDGVGPALWWEEFARTQALLPDLRVEVLRWAGAGENVFISHPLLGNRRRPSAELGSSRSAEDFPRRPAALPGVLLRLRPAGHNPAPPAPSLAPLVAVRRRPLDRPPPIPPAGLTAS
jgi:hypothetical protein